MQHGAGFAPLAVECDYKANGICQYPILHDLDGNNGGAVFKLIDKQGNDVADNNIGWTTTYRKFNTKSQADITSARIRTFKSRINTELKKTNTDKQVMSYPSNCLILYKHKSL